MIHQVLATLVLLTLAGLPAQALGASQKIVCSGNVSIFGDTGGTHLKELNSMGKGFQASDREVNFLRVGLEPGKPLIDIIPWGGVTQHPYKDNPHAKDVLVQFKTDGSTWFSVSLTGRVSKHQQRLTCSVRHDDQPRTGKPTSTTTSSRESRTKAPSESANKRAPTQLKQKGKEPKR